jgi:hypothetical protein
MKPCRSAEVNLLRAAAAAFLLIALVLSSASASACDGCQETLAVTPASFSVSLPRQPASASHIVQPGTYGDAVGPFGDHAGHCLCRCNLHCCSGATGFISPISASFPARSATSQQWMSLHTLRGELPKSPDERPPRLI